MNTSALAILAVLCVAVAGGASAAYLIMDDGSDDGQGMHESEAETAPESGSDDRSGSSDDGDADTTVYTVVWKDADGTVLETDSVGSGTVPVYGGAEPVKAATQQYTYIFAGWVPEVVPAAADTVYTAAYTQTVNEYTVEIAGGDVTVLNGNVPVSSGDKVAYGTVLTVSVPDGMAVAASRGAVVGGEYTVTGDVTFAGSRSTVLYTVTIVGDGLSIRAGGTEIASGSSVAYGTVLTVSAEDRVGYVPSAVSSAGEIVDGVYTVTGDVTFSVTYSIATYTITWRDDDGTVLRTDSAEYGTVPSYGGSLPSKSATEQYTYYFAGWTPEVTAAVGDAVYTAGYTWTANRYTVTIEGEGVAVLDGTAAVLSGDKVEYGTVLTVSIVTKDGYSGTVLVSDGSISDGTYIVTGDVTFTGTYKEISASGAYGDRVPSIDGFTVTNAEGTKDSYAFYYDPVNKVYTVVFTEVSEDTEYSISGTLGGSVIVKAGDTYEFKLTLAGITVTSTVLPCIDFESADKATISAKKGTVNYFYDKRAAVTGDGISSAVYAVMDLDLQGKGSLTVVSDSNNGIHTKDDLDVKNLTLSVSCADNALKGNDSVTISSGTIVLSATSGDGIKTTNSDLSSKNKQRGTVTVNSDDGDAVLTVRAACDGIDAAYDTVIEETEGNTVTVEIYTYTYAGSEYTGTGSGSSSTLYISAPSASYRYSVLVTKSDGGTVWESASTPFSSIRSFRSATYYYKMDLPSDALKVQLFVYSTGQSVGQSSSYFACSETKTFNSGYNMMKVRYISSGSAAFDWANYSQQSSGGRGGMGPGGMNDGNSNKLDYSAKGIKADNTVSISGGTLTVKAYDDAVHANADVVIESTNSYGKGDVIISGGTLTLTSKDDGVHADGTLTVSGGTVKVLESYEGLEGSSVNISGGNISVVSSDDGVNATATSGTALTVSGGRLYVYAGGDGLDSNSRTSKTGLVFSGGITIIISTSGGNSSIDTEAGYTYSGGQVLAICPNGMTQEVRNYISSYGTQTVKNMSLGSGSYVTAIGGGHTICVRMPVSISNAFIACLEEGTVTISVSASTSYVLDSDGVYCE